MKIFTKSQNPSLNSKKSILSSDNPNLLPLFVVVATIFAFLSLLFNFLDFLILGKLFTQKPPTLVELSNGTSVVAQPIGSDERTPQAIQQFVVDQMTALFSWSGFLPPSSPGDLPQPDPGVVIGNYKITTLAWQASFALADGFRESFTKKIAELTPTSVFQKRGTQTKLIFKHIGEPRLISRGKWKVPIVANLLIFQNNDNLGTKKIAFNKYVYVEAVTPKQLPPNPNSLDIAIFNARKAGLVIYSMPDLDLGN
jgi:hypothetical protein